MPWGKMDDKFHRNRKVRELLRIHGRPGREALGCWTFWWSWCLDDPELSGLVPSYELDTDEIESAKLLVTVGLWDATPDGYRFHDFHEYNPSREQREAKKSADRERVASKRGASREDVASDTDATGERLAPESEDVASTRAGAPSPPLPIPFPTQERDARPLAGPDGRRADLLRAGYESRFKRAYPKLKVPGQCAPMSGGPWLECARELTDEQVDPLLDALFADDWCRGGGCKLGMLASERVRLLADGPKVNGELRTAAPTSAGTDPVSMAQAARDRAEKALGDARRHRDSLAGGDGHAEAVADFLRKQRALGDADDALEAAKRGRT